MLELFLKKARKFAGFTAIACLVFVSADCAVDLNTANAEVFKPQQTQIEQQQNNSESNNGPKDTEPNHKINEQTKPAVDAAHNDKEHENPSSQKEKNRNDKNDAEVKNEDISTDEKNEQDTKNRKKSGNIKTTPVINHVIGAMISTSI